MPNAPVKARRAPVKESEAKPSPPPPAKSFKRSSGVKQTAQRTIIYGPGGVGKSSLLALAPGVLIIDLEGGTHGIDAERLEGVESFTDLRSALQDESLWKGVRTVGIDSGTIAQKLAVEWTVANVSHEKGHKVTSIEGYGYGKGYQFVLESFELLLADLDRHHIEKGRHVVIIGHDTTERFTNAAGADFVQVQPDFFQPPKIGRIRDRIKQWCDHLLYIEHERIVDDGKATSTGRRLIHPVEQGHFWAKSRTIRDIIDYAEGDDTFWRHLLPQEYSE